jgi:hypothetical protein
MKESGLLFAHGVLSANEVMIDYLDDTQRRLKRVMAEVDDVGLHCHLIQEPIVRDILNHLARARTQLLSALEGLSQTEITTVSVSDEWTLREVLAHIGGWTVWDLGTIRAIQEGNRPDLSIIRDVDRFNDRLLAERSEWSLDQILAEMNDAQAAILELLGSMTVQDLFDVGPFRGPYWDSLAEWLQIAWEHEEEHATQIRVWREQQGI